MAKTDDTEVSRDHSHVFLGAGHERNERKTWIVIALCTAMMVAEIVGGTLFGSLALVADGLHMSTHAGALMLAAVAYTYARKHTHDPRFTFGTGKVGDLAGYTSAIILAMIALLIAYEAVDRMLHPVAIDFNQALPIAALGLIVNVASAWLLSGKDHGHSHSHDHSDHNLHSGHDDPKRIDTDRGPVLLEIFEDGVPARFRIRSEAGSLSDSELTTVEIRRPDGERESFAFANHGQFRESVEEIPEPHEFFASLRIARVGGTEEYPVTFEEHGAGLDSQGVHHRDNNMRAALVHVIADAAVSVLVIAGLLLARAFGWLWMDPLAGLIGAVVIANWSWGLVGDTGAILLDRSADSEIERRIRMTIEDGGDKISDLHLWRLGPGHLGLILSVVTGEARGIDYYRRVLNRFPSMSHVTVEVRQAPAAMG